VIGGTKTANSLTGRGIDELLQRTDSAGSRFLLTDALGSTLALSDSTGALQTQYTYEPFGNAMASGAATTNSFAYTGRELDPTGLYFYRDRYYNPQLGRFISEDPVGFKSGINVYAYVGNNPISFVDPLGHDACKQIRRSVFEYINSIYELAKRGPINPPDNPIDYYEAGETANHVLKVAKCGKKVGKSIGDGVSDLINGGSCDGANF